MKIQCDVCEKDEASLFCIADEAAICSTCDHRVHHANKLAGKHQRFSLHQPSPKEPPLCDICQERRAFLFCQQDRAILCRECDIPIHKANEHTKTHTRFLLTGVKLSSTSTLYSAESASSSLNNNKSSVSNIKKPEDSKSTKPVCLIAPTRTPPTAKGTTFGSTTVTAPDKSNNNIQLVMMNGGNFDGTISASSISEYLEMLPGWHVEDFLDSPSPFGFSKNGENEVLQFWDHADFQTQNHSYQSMEMAFGFANGFIEQSNEFTSYNNNNNNNTIKSTCRKRSEDNSFAVPQISPHSSEDNFFFPM